MIHRFAHELAGNTRMWDKNVTWCKQYDCFWFWVVVVGLCLGGCQPQTTDQTTEPLSVAHDATDTTLRLSVEVVPPVGLDGQLVMPYEGQAAQRAELNLDEILEALPQPSYLAESGDPNDVSDSIQAEANEETQPSLQLHRDVNPPLAVQREYLAGRVAWLEGHQFRATQHLQNALRLCPNCPSILRLLGMIYIRSGSQARGAGYLEKAVQFDPGDTQSLMLLGRYKASEGLWPESIVTLATALQHSQSQVNDPAMGPLLQYLLGNALAHEGYDEAAVEQIKGFLTTPLKFDRTTRLVRELALLAQKRDSIWQLVGDAYNRLDRPQDAQIAYKEAAQLLDEIQGDLARRMVFTSLRMRQDHDAKQTVLSFVKAAGPTDDSVGLVRYLSQYSRFHSGFVDELRRIYERDDRPASLAIAIADLSDSSKAAEFLLDHLEHRPADRQVFEFLLHELTSKASSSASGLRWAIDGTRLAVSQLPTAAREYSDLLIASVSSAVSLRNSIIKTQSSSSWVDSFILAKLADQEGDHEGAITALEKVLELDPELLEARLQLAGWLIDRGRFDQAAQRLDGAPDADHPQVVEQRVRLFRHTGRGSEALLLLDRLIVLQPYNVQWAIDKAKIQLTAGTAGDAESTLLAALDRQSTAEVVYEELVALYESGLFSKSHSTKGYQSLLRRLWSSIPRSRLAQLERAKVLTAGGRFDQAEPMLRNLLSETPDDAKALDVLLAGLVQAQRDDEANELIGQRISDATNDRKLLTVALRHYRRVQDAPNVVVIAEKLLAQLTSDQPRDLQSIDKILAVMDQFGGSAQSDQWIEQRLFEMPSNQMLLAVAQRHYARTQNKQRLFDVTRQYLLLQSPQP